jgi:hypothetical protein
MAMDLRDVTAKNESVPEYGSTASAGGELAEEGSAYVPTNRKIVEENVRLSIAKLGSDRQQILFGASLVLIFTLLALFAYGFCSYIGVTKTMLRAEVVKQAVDKITLVAGNQQLHSPDWHFLLILAELLVSMVLVFLITMKAVFPKAEDQAATITGDVGESAKTLVEFVKSLWSKG